MVDVGTILVNYNHERDVIRTCEKIKNQCKEIVVVDNSEPSPELREYLHDAGLTYIDSGGNLGYAAGNNIGINHLSESCDCYFVLNPDVELPDPGIIRRLAEQLSNDPDLGILAPAIGESSTQHAGTATVRLMSKMGYLPELQPRDDQLVPRHQVVGCAMMISADVVEAIGLLDEQFFLYVEEIEYCYRARSNGYEIAYDPTCMVLHGQNEGLSHPHSYQIYYRTRNTFLLADRRFSGMSKVCYWSVAFIILYTIVINRQWGVLNAWREGIFDGVRGCEGRSRYLTE